MKNDKGFTLVEVLVAVAIMALITILAFPSVRQFQATNAKKKFKTYELTAKTSAKLYVDSYQEDLFGYNHTGCADITFEELEKNNLLKKYAENNISCTKDSYVHVNKIGEKFSYVINMKCINDKNEEVYSNFSVGDEVKCDTDEDGNFSVKFSGIGKEYTKKKTIKVKIKDTDGLLENINVTYFLKKVADDECVDSGSYRFENKRGKKEVSFDYETPSNLTGDYYLEIGTGSIRDVYGNSPTGNVSSSKEQPIKLDNMPPEKVAIKNDYENTSTDKPYSVLCKSHDEHSGIGYYQYRYPNSSVEKEKEWKSYKDSAKDEFTTTEFSKARNEIVQIRACDKLDNCSEPGESRIIIANNNVTCADLEGKIKCKNLSADSDYLIEYDGECDFICDDPKKGDWRIKFLTTGTLTTNLEIKSDVFLVGRGGKAGIYYSGGGGGYTRTYSGYVITPGSYDIVVGGSKFEVEGKTKMSPKESSAFGYEAKGGGDGGYDNNIGYGGNGGSGGGGGQGGSPGGSDGGGAPNSYGGKGQGTTTREFGEKTGALYASGGSGQGYKKAKPNTGDGGSSGDNGDVGYGASGIVIIRNYRNTLFNMLRENFAYSGSNEIIVEDDTNWKIRFYTNGTLTVKERTVIDIFLVGGGGAAGSYYSGGGGGYTLTKRNITLEPGNYDFIVGRGASDKTNQTNSPQAESSSAFGFVAAGGFSGGYGGYSLGFGGNGGSGGGGGRLGGIGASDGGDAPNSNGGKGQGTTTREFGEATGALYASGGSGYAQENGAPRTGNGGSRNGTEEGGSGGSGIIIIRNKR